MQLAYSNLATCYLADSQTEVSALAMRWLLAGCRREGFDRLLWGLSQGMPARLLMSHGRGLGHAGRD